MPQLFNIDANFFGALTPYVGSFWTSRFGQKAQVDILLNLALATKQNAMFRSTVSGLAGDDTTARLEKFVVVPFDASDVTKSGQLLYDDPDYTQYYQSGQSDVEAYGQDGVRYFVLPITTHIPKAIQTPQIRLLLGVDFFVVKDKWIFFRQDPRILFPDKRIKMTLAEQVGYKPLNSFLIRANVSNDSQYVTRYCRHNQTPGAFKLALAAVAGLTIIHYDQKLLSARKYLNTTVYTFEQETLRVNYDHTPLIVGTTYTADRIIGDGVQIFYDQGDGKTWWRQLNWGAGISLDPILKTFSGLPLLDRDTLVYSAGSDPGSVDGSKLHARIKLTDDFYSEEPYWDWVAARETGSGYYINGLVGLPEDPTSSVPTPFGYNYPSLPSLNLLTEDWLSLTLPATVGYDYGSVSASVLYFDDYGPIVPTAMPGESSVPIFSSSSNTFRLLLAQYAAANELNKAYGWPIEQPDIEALPNSKLINALDFFFEAVLQKKGMVILIDRDQIENLSSFYRFMQREMLAGVVPIVISRSSRLEIESVSVGDTIDVDSSALTIAPTTPRVLLEAVDLSSVMTDAVTLN